MGFVFLMSKRLYFFIIFIFDYHRKQKVLLLNKFTIFSPTEAFFSSFSSAFVLGSTEEESIYTLKLSIISSCRRVLFFHFILLDLTSIVINFQQGIV
jgi:hypothetical protein